MLAGPHAAFIAAVSESIHPATVSSTQSSTAVEFGPGEKPPSAQNEQGSFGNDSKQENEEVGNSWISWSDSERFEPGSLKRFHESWSVVNDNENRSGSSVETEEPESFDREDRHEVARRGITDVGKRLCKYWRTTSSNDGKRSILERARE